MLSRVGWIDDLCLCLMFNTFCNHCEIHVAEQTKTIFTVFWMIHEGFSVNLVYTLIVLFKFFTHLKVFLSSSLSFWSKIYQCCLPNLFTVNFQTFFYFLPHNVKVSLWVSAFWLLLQKLLLISVFNLKKNFQNTIPQ